MNVELAKDPRLIQDAARRFAVPEIAPTRKIIISGMAFGATPNRE